MKVLQLSFLILCVFSIECYSMTVSEYVRGQRTNIERAYTPITPLMCRRFRKFSKLRSCKLLQSNPKVLDDYSAKYFTSLNQWKSVTFLNRRGVGSLEVASMLIRKFTESLSTRTKRDNNEDFLHRRKRQTTEEATTTEVTDSRRGSRRVSGNPCVHGRAVRTAIIYAVDSETGQVVELYQDPNNLLFQTFYTKKCFPGSIYGMRCMPQYIEFQSPVYKSDSLEVVLRFVKIPTSCAMSFS